MNQSSEPSGAGLEPLRDPSPDFVDRVLAIVHAIPSGRVMAYGDVAAEIGEHRDLAGMSGSYGARLVGQVMSRSGAETPWWRVLRSTGHPPRFHEEQAYPLYLSEGTPLIGTREDYRIDMKKARYQPGATTADQTTLDLF